MGESHVSVATPRSVIESSQISHVMKWMHIRIDGRLIRMDEVVVFVLTWMSFSPHVSV